MKCHAQCTTCSGYGATFCTSCRHYKQEDECVSKCQDDYFVNPENNECLQCDPQCLHCHGPTAADCTRCKLYKVYSHSKVGEITAMVSDGEIFLHCWFCRFCNWMCWIFILNVCDPNLWGPMKQLETLLWKLAINFCGLPCRTLVVDIDTNWRRRLFPTQKSQIPKLFK